MIINHNMASLNTYRQMSTNTANTSKSLEKLSSGLRINKAGDDAAGLAISEKMRGQIRGLDQAARNAQDGVSMIQTAEGSLSETHSILQRMKELATQSANDTNTTSDRTEIQKEMNQLTSEINRIGNTTEFNTQKLLDGGAGANKTALSSNEAVGTAARGAVLQSLDPASVVANSFGLDDQEDIGIKINGVVFSLDSDTGGGAEYNAEAMAMADGTAKGLQDALLNLKSSDLGIKLSDLADVNVSENGVVSITAKGTGDASQISFVVASTGVDADATEAATLLGDLGLAATLDFTSDVVKGTNGTAAEITGNAIDTTAFGTGSDKINADTAVGKKFDLSINGETYNVTIDVNAAKVASGLSTDNDIDGLAATLNEALKTATDKDGNTVDLSSTSAADIKVSFTVSADNELILTMDDDTIPTDGSNPTLKLSGDYASTLLNGIEDGQNAIGGTFTAKLQIGANNGQSFQMDIKDMRSQALGISGTVTGGSAGSVADAKFTATNDVTNGTNNTGVEYALDVSSHESATAAIKVLDNAIQSVSAQRSQLGAYTNRLEHTITNLGTSSENLTAAESRVRDVDMAKEMMQFQKNNILSQAAQAMMAQANQQPQGVLQLLR